MSESETLPAAYAPFASTMKGYLRKAVSLARQVVLVQCTASLRWREHPRCRACGWQFVAYGKNISWRFLCLRR